MEIRLLGPVELCAAGRSFDVGGPQARLVLAALAADAGRPVSTESLIDRVWDQAPAGARRTLQVQLTGVRRLLERVGAVEPPAVLVERRAGGYCLEVAPEQVDLRRFLDLVQQADGVPDDHARAESLGAALALWRGTPLAGLSGEWADRTRQFCRGQQLQALVSWAKLRIDAGRPADTLGPLADLLADQPYAEPAIAALLRALHAAGRTAEALAAYTTARERLADELGTDPGSELRAAHQHILSAGPAAPPGTGPAPVRPNQLPAAARYFIGRSRELSRLVQPIGDRTQTLVAVNGMPGNGKTALAVLAAHQLTESGRFPDGSLYLDLHGYGGTTPTEPSDALEALLLSLGVPGQQIPGDTDSRAGQYRSLTAGRRILIVLDNARDERQVRPLLPGSNSCHVIITSRRRLAGLDDANHVTLDTLSPREAIELFQTMVGADGDPGDQWTVAEIVRLCGLLPLAIRIAATRLKASAGLNGPQVLRQLQAAQAQEASASPDTGRLGLFDDGDRSVMAALEVSYRHLPPDQQRAFRTLGLHPGRSLEPYAVAALFDCTVGESTRLLLALEQVNMLEQAAPGRYRFHDLVRAYASTRHGLPAAEASAARGRLYDHYGRTASSAMDAACPSERGYRPAPPEVGTPIPVLADYQAAAAWLIAEQPNLLDTALHAAGDQPSHTIHQAATLHRHLRLRGAFSVAGPLQRAAADAAAASGDRAGEMAALHALAQTCVALHDLEAAERSASRALELARTLGSTSGELESLNGLGGIDYRRGRYDSAQVHLDRALELAVATGNTTWELNTLNGLGRVHRRRARFSSATGCHTRALELARATENRIGELVALNGLAESERVRGNPRQATEWATRALTLSRAVANPHSELDALVALGLAGNELGNQQSAVHTLTTGIELARELHATPSLALLLYERGRAHRALDQRDLARRDWERALTALSEVDSNAAPEVTAEEIRAQLYRI